MWSGEVKGNERTAKDPLPRGAAVSKCLVICVQPRTWLVTSENTRAMVRGPFLALPGVATARSGCFSTERLLWQEASGPPETRVTCEYSRCTRGSGHHVPSKGNPSRPGTSSSQRLGLKSLRQKAEESILALRQQLLRSARSQILLEHGVSSGNALWDTGTVQLRYE